MNPADDVAPSADRSIPGIEAHWAELVTAALLGTDRRAPPEAPTVLADLVADTARAAPSERMLAQVAACTAVRRAGVRPHRPVAATAPPERDDRPVCPPAAVRRWHHVVTTWPVLEDEWVAVLIVNGWRAAPELVPALVHRARSDPLRRSRALAAAGPLGAWLVEHLPELGRASRRGSGASTSDPAVATEVLELPELPIPPDLAALREASASRIAATLGSGIESGRFAVAHRGVLVNLVARIPEGALDRVAGTLGATDPRTSGHGVAAALADLATTRRRMLDELALPDPRAGA